MSGAACVTCPACNGAGTITLEATTVGARITIMRSAKNWSRKQLAERLGTHETALGNLEGNRKPASLKMLERLAAEFGCNMKDLIP